MNFASLNNLLPQSRTEAPAQVRITTNKDAAARDELHAGLAFAAALGAKLDDGLDGSSELDAAALQQQRQQEQVREAAQQLVASAFVLPFLQQVRSESLKSDLFHGGYAEEAFGQQLDTHMADAFVKGSNFPLVEAVEQYMAKRGGPLPQVPGQQVNVHG